MSEGGKTAGTKIMRILALDHGTKRIGLAISDELGMIAQPLEFVLAEPFAKFLERLKEVIRDKQVEQLLVGMPRNMDGSYGPAALKAQEFVAALRDGGDDSHQNLGRAADVGAGQPVSDPGRTCAGTSARKRWTRRRRRFCCRVIWTACRERTQTRNSS